MKLPDSCDDMRDVILTRCYFDFQSLAVVLDSNWWWSSARRLEAAAVVSGLSSLAIGSVAVVDLAEPRKQFDNFRSLFVMTHNRRYCVALFSAIRRPWYSGV